MVPYGTVDATIQPHIYLKKLYYNEVTAKINKFQAYGIAEILWIPDSTNSKQYKFCYGAALATQKIIMAIDTAMRFKDCYK